MKYIFVLLTALTINTAVFSQDCGTFESFEDSCYREIERIRSDSSLLLNRTFYDTAWTKDRNLIVKSAKQDISLASKLVDDTKSLEIMLLQTMAYSHCDSDEKTTDGFFSLKTLIEEVMFEKRENLINCRLRLKSYNEQL